LTVPVPSSVWNITMSNLSKFFTLVKLMSNLFMTFLSPVIY
jgi:hypothetical protein